MQYFTALKIGEKRVKSAQDILKAYTGSAMPALALKDNKSDQWEPVGEENFYGVVKESNGYMIVICDKNGIAKSLANWFTEEEKNQYSSKNKVRACDGGIRRQTISSGLISTNLFRSQNLQLYHSVLDVMIDCEHVSLYDIKHAC